MLEGAQAAAVDPERPCLGVGIRRLGKDAGPDGPGAQPAAERGRPGGDPLPDLHQGGRGGDGEPHRRAARGLGADDGCASLRKELIALAGRSGPAALQRARRLFAKVLEAPGGLRIQTIHSFAQALLASFPAEAGITPGFTPIEGRAEQELARTTLANLLADAEARGDEQPDRATCSASAFASARKARVKYLMRCARVAGRDGCTRVAGADRADAPAG